MTRRRWQVMVAGLLLCGSLASAWHARGTIFYYSYYARHPQAGIARLADRFRYAVHGACSRRTYQVAWADRYRVVAHALGGIHGQTYTNAREAFIQNYRRGVRVFEADFIFSLDDALLISHDRRYVTHRHFLASSPAHGLTALDASDLLDLLEQYPDVYLVTDTKQDLRASLAALVAHAAGRDDVLARIVPQIYHPADLAIAMELYPFASICLTLYRSPMSNAQLLRFVQATGLACVVMRDDRASPALLAQLQRMGTKVFVHTINDSQRAGELVRMGASGVFTDTLTPQSLNRRVARVGS